MDTTYDSALFAEVKQMLGEAASSRRKMPLFVIVKRFCPKYDHATSKKILQEALQMDLGWTDQEEREASGLVRAFA